MDRIRAELFAATRALLDRAPDIRALVLECTDLPPHAHGLQQEFGLPIFDLTTLATMIDMAVRQQRYPGFT